MSKLQRDYGWLVDQVNSSNPPAGKMRPNDPIMADILWQMLADGDAGLEEQLHAAAWIAALTNRVKELESENCHMWGARGDPKHIDGLNKIVSLCCCSASVGIAQEALGDG